MDGWPGCIHVTPGGLGGREPALEREGKEEKGGYVKKRRWWWGFLHEVHSTWLPSFFCSPARNSTKVSRRSSAGSVVRQERESVETGREHIYPLPSLSPPSLTNTPTPKLAIEKFLPLSLHPRSRSDALLRRPLQLAQISQPLPPKYLPLQVYPAPPKTPSQISRTDGQLRKQGL